MFDLFLDHLLLHTGITGPLIAQGSHILGLGCLEDRIIRLILSQEKAV